MGIDGGRLCPASCPLSHALKHALMTAMENYADTTHPTNQLPLSATFPLPSRPTQASLSTRRLCAITAYADAIAKPPRTLTDIEQKLILKTTGEHRYGTPRIEHLVLFEADRKPQKIVY